MHRMLLKLIVGLCCVLVNAAFLMLFPHGHLSGYQAIADEPMHLWHPVLHEEPTLRKPLDDSSLRKMINLTIPEGSRRQWGDNYGRIEEKAASQLCSRLKGLSEAEVVNLLGPPAFKTGAPM